ncbi:response regulator PleD [mine drainage metagenome]|uniref:Response regulator PleD n=1 Tax=mine drainage metagenome TaxID=410659 RepID=A0A1J5R0U2_9ZZZZ
MEQKSTPIELARQTLMQLVQRKLPPTPDNYRSVYDEIAGLKSVDKSLELGKSLAKVLNEAGKKQPKYIAVAQAITPLVETQDWKKLEDQLHKLFVTDSASAGAMDVNWSILIRSLLKQLEVSHKGVTLSRKKEGLSKVLSNFGSDPSVLGQKIQALMSSWGVGSGESEALASEVIDAAVTQSPIAASVQATATVANSSSNKVLELWRDMLLKTFELVLIPHLHAVPDQQQKATALLAKMQQAHTEPSLSKCATELRPVLLNIEIQRDLQHRTHASLLQLLRLVVSNMGELMTEDKWFQGQAKVINEIISKPLNLNTLYDAESSLKELTYKQSQIRPALTDAKDTLKKMVSTFVDRLVEMTESTSDYHGKIEGYQQKITSTEDIGELNKLLNNILDDTRAIGLSVQRTRDEFSVSQQKALIAEKKIQELTAELDHISEVAHQDYLTGALNRRGMDEAIEREFNRADRHNANLCIAMMDIDHFKKLNDTLGHSTGDKALTYFAKVIKEVLRTTDVLARYGGEEFIIIMPATPKNEAVSVVTRVQRELTKNFFMHNSERVLITFSAGVAERKPGEPPETLIPRADAALYEAKNSGRNRVVAAEDAPD